MSSKFTELMAQARNRQAEPPAEDREVKAEAEPTPGRQASAARAADENTPAPAETGKQKPLDGEAHAPQEQAPQEQAPPESAARLRGRPRGKRSHPDFEQVSAYISRRTHLSVKIALLQEGQGREFSELVEELLGQWLQR